MASIGRDKGGRKRILFVAEDGSRKTIRLGKASMRQAEHFKIRLEALIAGRFSGIDAETAKWLAALPDDIYGRLVAVGLAEARAPKQVALLGPFVAQYIASRHDVKQRTKWVLRQAQQSLMAYFGADKRLDEITEGDAELWWQAMVKEGLAEATRRKRAQNAKQFFRFACKQGLVAANPFRGLKSSAVANDKRLQFISHEDIEKVIAASPDHEWRLIWALCRFAGLRCPSEVMALRWEDVNWERDRMTVTSAKTERHAGGATRIVPIFAALRPYMVEAFERAAPGAVYCISRHRVASANLRTTARKIIRRAGLQCWERTFQNLRASAEMELTERFPLHVVSAWIGHSTSTAMKHYLAVRDEDFQRAAQNPAQHAHESCAQTRTEKKPTLTESAKNRDVLVSAGTCDTVHESLLAPRGFEPLLPG
ncbi:MAG: site-specific integrase [Phycisphaerales bacterium]|nr:MAG: site-specific integrase [Phycisphaerales bacterium]